MSIPELESKYVGFFSMEPTEEGVIEGLEKDLSLVLPEDFKVISRFYRGGFLGGKSHHAISLSGPATNILDETKRLRYSANLPENLLVIAEPAASLIVLETKKDSRDETRVIWLDATDVANLHKIDELRAPEVWNSYASFFEYLLEEEEDERSGS